MTNIPKNTNRHIATDLCHTPKQLQHHNNTQRVKINRLLSRKSVLENYLKTTSHHQRRARTRTLIQMGALLTLTDIPSLLSIKEGDDLQHDIHTMDKAAALLGLILSFREHLPPSLSDASYEDFKKIGIRHMKKQKSYSTSNIKNKRARNNVIS